MPIICIMITIYLTIILSYYLFISHRSGSGIKIKKMSKISSHFSSVGIHALSYHHEFQNVLMSPFGDIDNQIFFGSITQ